jgi:hypothetical protein
VDFDFAPECSHVDVGDGPIQDLSLHGCTREGIAEGKCNILVLPRQGKRLISCPLNTAATATSTAQNATTQTEAWPLGRAWLRDRGGEPLDARLHQDGFLQPEELSAVGSVPCSAGSASSTSNGDCVVVGTTARRVVLLSVKELADKKSTWVPHRLLQSDHGEVPQPGAFTLFGDRYLGALSQGTGRLSMMDLHQGGSHAGTWQLPPAPKDAGASQWTSICGGGNSTIYALADGDKPALYRFTVPSLASLTTAPRSTGKYIPL